MFLTSHLFLEFLFFLIFAVAFLIKFLIQVLVVETDCFFDNMTPSVHKVVKHILISHSLCCKISNLDLTIL